MVVSVCWPTMAKAIVMGACLLAHNGDSHGGRCLLAHNGESNGGRWLLAHNGDSHGGGCLLGHNGDSHGGGCLLGHNGDSHGGGCLLARAGDICETAAEAISCLLLVGSNCKGNAGDGSGNSILSCFASYVAVTVKKICLLGLRVSS